MAWVMGVGLRCETDRLYLCLVERVDCAEGKLEKEFVS